MRQLLKNKLVGKDKKKKKRRSGSESSGSEAEEEGEAWKGEVKKPMTEFEKLQVCGTAFLA